MLFIINSVLVFIWGVMLVMLIPGALRSIANGETSTEKWTAASMLAFVALTEYILILALTRFFV